LVVGRDLGDELGVDSNSSNLRRGESESNGLVVGSLGELRDELRGEGVLSGLVDGSSTDGVEENSKLVLQVVRRVLCEIENEKRGSQKGEEERRVEEGRKENATHP